MAPKKVCMVTLEYPPDQWGGFARTVENVAHHVRDMGMEVHVAHFTVLENAAVLLDENRKDEDRDGIPVHRFQVGMEDLEGSAMTIWDFPHTRTFKMMYQSLELLHNDLHFNLFHGFFLYPTGYIAGLLARRMQVPAIATLVGNDVKKYIFCPEMTGFCRSGLENADRVVGLSHDLLMTANALSPVANKGCVIFNSVPIPRVSWKPRSIHGRPLNIGCAGIFKYAKGLPYLFKAIQALRQRHDITLQLAGTLRDSEKSTYRSMAENSGISDILNFQPAIAHDSVPEWLCALDVFVLSSVSEGCPNILMEAMACGLPCVATRVGAVEDLMEDGVSGLIVPWGNATAITEALDRILRSPDRGLSLGRAARKRMRMFSSKRKRREWKTLYREII